MIPKKILEAFGITCEGVQLEGGQGSSYRFNEIILKPIENQDYYQIISEYFSKVSSTEFRISAPIMSRLGYYTFEGYGATRFEPGYDDDSKLKEKLEVASKFHKELLKLSIDTLPSSDDPWTCANKVLWSGESLPTTWPEETRLFCTKILDQLDEIHDEHQLIHGDLGGNILFHKTLTPLIIDFSPTIAPKKYADAIIICDSIAWAGAPLSSLELLQPMKTYQPYIKYAVAFRLITLAFLNCHNMGRIRVEWDAFKDIWLTINN